MNLCLCLSLGMQLRCSKVEQPSCDHEVERFMLRVVEQEATRNLSSR